MTYFCWCSALHEARVAAEGYRAVVVTADDIDLAFSVGISCHLFQKCGTKNRIRYIDINKLRHGLGYDVCNSLIGVYSDTGCDTVCAFAGRGKLGTLKLMSSEHCQEMFRELGQSWKPPADLFRKLQAFTCKLYTSSTTTVDINTARHQLFCARRGELESTQLPPCDDRLFMHTVCANNQSGIWRCSLQQHPQVASPV